MKTYKSFTTVACSDDGPTVEYGSTAEVAVAKATH